LRINDRLAVDFEAELGRRAALFSLPRLSNQPITRKDLKAVIDICYQFINIEYIRENGCIYRYIRDQWWSNWLRINDRLAVDFEAEFGRRAALFSLSSSERPTCLHSHVYIPPPLIPDISIYAHGNCIINIHIYYVASQFTSQTAYSRSA
jgi:hypothetical protein